MTERGRVRRGGGERVLFGLFGLVLIGLVFVYPTANTTPPYHVHSFLGGITPLPLPFPNQTTHKRPMMVIYTKQNKQKHTQINKQTAHDI